MEGIIAWSIFKLVCFNQTLSIYTINKPFPSINMRQICKNFRAFCNGKNYGSKIDIKGRRDYLMPSK